MDNFNNNYNNNDYNNNYNNNYNNYPQNYQPYQQPNYYNAPAKPKQNGKGIASMVLGIVSLITWCCWIGIATGVIGLILGIFSKKEKPENNGMATAGIIMSVIAIALFVVITVLAVVLSITGDSTYYNFSFGD